MDETNFNISNVALFHDLFSKSYYLSRLLTYILEYEVKESDITYLDTEVSKNRKTNRYDILVLVGKKHYIRIDLEMQNKWYDYMPRRMLQYQSRLHEQEYSVNEYDQNDCKTIWIVNTALPRLSKKWKFDYGWIEKKTQDNFFETDDSIIIVNLKNINQCPIIELKELSLCFTKEYKELKNHDFKFDFSKEVYNYMEKVNLRDQALQWDAWIAQDNQAEKELLEKLKKDLATVKEEAKEAAKEAEMNSKKNMIISMYENNIDIDTICKVTSLSLDQVNKILGK